MSYIFQQIFQQLIYLNMQIKQLSISNSQQTKQNHKKLETPNQEQQLLMDFSNVFKKNINKKPFKPLLQKKNPKNNTSNWLLQVPTNIKITLQDIKQRKIFDMRRWMCISRPQYQRSCGISSLVSVWNYLYSKIGTGKLQPINVQSSLQILGVISKGQQFQNVDFGDFTGNFTLMQWFTRLCKHFGVKGQSKIILKLSGEDKTACETKQSLDLMLNGLKGQEKGYIYHAYDHYFCPVGYQITPNNPLQAYKKISEIKIEESQLWIIIGQTSKNHPVFHIRKWKDILLDLQTKWPYYLDIRDLSKGVRKRPNANQTNQNQDRGTSHCIIQFKKLN